MLMDRRRLMRAVGIVLIAAPLAIFLGMALGLTPWSPVSVSLSPVGSATVSVGSPVRFRASSSQSGYGHLYVASASGKVVLIAENLPVKAHQPIELPNGDFILQAAPPLGDDTVLFVATRDRMEGFAGSATTTTPAEFKISASGLVAQLEAKLAETPHDRWAFTTVTVRVVE
jgi:hypothetical protein